MPRIANCSNFLKPAKVNNNLVDFIDFLATFYETAKLTVFEAWNTDIRSFFLLNYSKYYINLKMPGLKRLVEAYQKSNRELTFGFSCSCSYLVYITLYALLECSIFYILLFRTAFNYSFPNRSNERSHYVNSKKRR